MKTHADYTAAIDGWNRNLNRSAMLGHTLAILYCQAQIDRLTRERDTLDSLLDLKAA